MKNFQRRDTEIAEVTRSLIFGFKLCVLRVSAVNYADGRPHHFAKSYIMTLYVFAPPDASPR